MTALPHGLISQRAVRHSAMWRCRKEKDNSLTVLTEREGGEEGGRRGMRWEGEVRRRRRASTCSSDAPWRDGGMEGRKMWPQTADTSQPGHVYCPLETIRSVQVSSSCCYCTLTPYRESLSGSFELIYVCILFL